MVIIYRCLVIVEFLFFIDIIFYYEWLCVNDFDVYNVKESVIYVFFLMICMYLWYEI